MKKTDYIVLVNQDGTQQRVWQDKDGKKYIRIKKIYRGWQYRLLDTLPCKRFISFSPNKI